MEREAYRQLYQIAWRLGQQYRSPHVVYPNHLIVCVLFWAVIHERPIDWACRRCNWPAGAQMTLPSGSTMSRRLAKPQVQALIDAIEQLLVCRVALAAMWFIDARPLPVGHASGDRDAQAGYAGRVVARGYKLHAVFNENGVVANWSVQPMNQREPIVARQLIPRIRGRGILVGDNAYDSNALYDLAATHDLQLVAPTRKQAKGLGHRRHSPHRLYVRRSMTPKQRWKLYRQRSAIERFFGRFATMAGGLAPLPPSVRSLRRVRRWVQVKLIFYHLTAVKTP
jgi:hypothetical protein